MLTSRAKIAELNLSIAQGFSYKLLGKRQFRTIHFNTTFLLNNIVTDFKIKTLKIGNKQSQKLTLHGMAKYCGFSDFVCAPQHTSEGLCLKFSRRSFALYRALQAFDFLVLLTFQL
ncbi:MAG: hypothetical protein DBY32_05400 [Phascolarctobacterium sp.]|nr:MAG: hypothetical protein DBY32_05400 [Phascolarctobacterium sp.]